MPVNLTRTVSLACLALILAACQSAPSLNPAITDASVSAGSDTVSIEIAPAPANTPVAQLAVQQPESIPPITSVWQRVRYSLQLSQHYNHPSVDVQIENYRNNQRFFDLISERASPFLFNIVEEIEGRGLPMELALLPMVESTFNPNAYSRENAVGLWQFLGATGREFGLQQDWWYDGRRDPENSTRAALDYLEQLYSQFDEDWLLALAAYNTGGANLNRALRRSDSDSMNFWDLRLAAETRFHIPKILALSKIIVNPEEFGITLTEIPNKNPIATVDVGSQIDLAMVAELVDISLDDLKHLNPGYLQWATHPEAPQTVAVPKESIPALQRGLADLDPSQYVTWEHYRIRSGDTLGAIARRLNTAVDVLQVVNRLSGTQIIAGRSLLIPRGTAAADYTNLTAPVMRELPASVPATYSVRSGDNLWLIARRFDLRSQEIADHNGLSLESLLHPGQQLDLSFAQSVQLATDTTIPQADPDTYSVRRGDSMQKIARQTGIGLEDLLQWNGLNRRDLIFPGQQLRITAP